MIATATMLLHVHDALAQESADPEISPAATIETSVTPDVTEATKPQLDAGQTDGTAVTTVETVGSDDAGQADDTAATTVETGSSDEAVQALDEPPKGRSAFEILGSTVQPGTAVRLSWSVTELFEGVPVTTPVLVVHGNSDGPTLCLTAALHGDELNGIEIVRRVMHDIKADRLSGTVIGVPIVNVQGFRRGSRYLPDRRDLNRYFPGNPNGSAASRIAFSLFSEVIIHCDALVDLHTGSFERTNLPQLRADLRNPSVISIAQGFGSTVVIHGAPTAGTLRYAASKAGIPSVTMEAGGPSQLELDEVKHGVKGIETLLTTLGMVRKLSFWGEPEPVYYRSSWVRANHGGILLADVNLGSTVRKGDRLGTITDPMNNDMAEIISPYAGRVIGMARNQVVMPGFATFHIGIQTDQPAVPSDSEATLETEEAGLMSSDVDADIEIDQATEGAGPGDDEYIDGTSQ